MTERSSLVALVTGGARGQGAAHAEALARAGQGVVDEVTDRSDHLGLIAQRELILPEVRWGDMDPTRRQLMGRAQNANVRFEAMVEVESPAAALAPAARGVGDTIISLPLADKLGYLDRLHWVPLDPPLLETFAFITRQGADVSPAGKVLMRLMAARLAKLRATPPAYRR